MAQTTTFLLYQIPPAGLTGLSELPVALDSNNLTTGTALKWQAGGLPNLIMKKKQNKSGRWSGDAVILKRADTPLSLAQNLWPTATALKCIFFALFVMRTSLPSLSARLGPCRQATLYRGGLRISQAWTHWWASPETRLPILDFTCWMERRSTRQQQEEGIKARRRGRLSWNKHVLAPHC